MNTLKWNQRRYTAYGPIYDLIVRPLERGRRQSIELLNVQPGEQVLIVGAGTGADLPFLPRSANITAIDLTPAMVQRCIKRGQQTGHTLHAAVMNAQALALPSAAFYAVILHLVLAVVPDPIACIREAARVLRPAGRIVIFDKFLADNAQATALRQLLNLMATTVFSDINRQLAPLLSAAHLRLEQDLPAGLNGMYRIACATKQHDRNPS